MTSIKRRHFLQGAGSMLAALGLSQWDVMQQGDRYGRVLAQSTSRKLALLVGVNQYANGIRGLQGCLTDVDLQRELLLHRFGFQRQDILAISDTESLKPTRANILEAFEQHLIKQAQPGDVVVFHFSGHGSLLLDPSPNALYKNAQGQAVNGTLVPSDRLSQDNQVQDIMGRSLFLLMQALQTDSVTAVLDSCHSGGGTRGNLTVRAISSRLDSSEIVAPSAMELDYQKRWLADLKLSEAEFNQRRQKIAKGVVIGSTSYDQLAADAPFGDFHAGAFTYLLTRYLWQQTANDSVESLLTQLSLSTNDVAKSAQVMQVPIYEANPKSNEQQPIYFSRPVVPYAEAVVRQVSPGQVEFWLGGLSSRSLGMAKAGSVFTVIDRTGQAVGEIEQTDRRGLVAVGKVRQGQVVPGMLLRETVRGIPTDLKLRLGVDASVAIEQVRSALQPSDRVELLPVDQTSVMDYLLGRMTPALLKQLPKGVERPVVGSIGLFTSGLEPIAPTFGSTDQEMVAAAIDRLRPRLKSLLAGRILQLAVGSDGAKRLNVATAVVPAGGATAMAATRFKTGTNIQVKVRNAEQRNLYMAVLVIGSSGKITVLYPYWEAPEDAALLKPGQELAVPQAGDSYEFGLKGSGGFLEVMTIASTKPLRDALKGIQAIARGRGIGTRSLVPLEEDSLAVVGDLLGDFDRHTREADIEVKGNVRAVDATQMTAISTLIQVVGS